MVGVVVTETSCLCSRLEAEGYDMVHAVADCLALTCMTTLQYGNGTLRLTTRQTYQLHGVLKQDLKTVFSSVIKAMGTTLGACGDVNRYVCIPFCLAMPCPAIPEVTCQDLFFFPSVSKGDCRDIMPSHRLTLPNRLTVAVINDRCNCTWNVVAGTCWLHRRPSRTGQSMRMQRSWRWTWPSCWRPNQAPTMTSGWTARSLSAPLLRYDPQ